MNIYLLRDPIDLIVKYVGITKKTAGQRLKCHIKDTKTRHRKNQYLSNKEKWILGLLQLNLTPIAECILSNVSEELAIDIEPKIISIYKREFEGGSLKNVQSGGYYESNKATPWNKGLKNCYSDNFIHQMKLNQPLRKPIFGFDKNGNLLDEWPSIRTLCFELKLDRRAVQRCLNKDPNFISHKKYMFSYDQNDIPVYTNKSTLLYKQTLLNNGSK